MRYSRGSLAFWGKFVGLALLSGLILGLVTLVSADSARDVQVPPLPENYTAKVAIAKGTNYSQVTRQAVTLAGGLQGVVKPGETVLIKPNLVGASKSGMGRITDYRVVQELVNLAREAGAARVLVSEGPVDTAWDYTFTVAGYKQITGAELHNLDTTRANCDIVTLDRSLTGLRWYLPEIWFNVDRIIDVAVMKTHYTAGTTLSLKNIGIGLPPKMIYGPNGSKGYLHDQNIDRVIPEINAMRKADLYVIDGMVGGEGQGPTQPTPRPMNVVLASKDPVALDTIGTMVMGYDPTEIAHIVYAAGIGLGTNDLSRITVVGETVDSVKADPPFVRPKAADGAPYKKATVIKETTVPVKIDGDLTEWSKAMVNKMDDSTRVVQGGSSWQGPADLSATARLMHDFSHIYFALEIRDDAAGKNAGDTVQLALSFTRVFKQKTNTYKLMSTSDDIILGIPLQAGMQQVTATNTKAAVAGASATVKVVGNTYIVEGVVPLASLAGLPGTRGYNLKIGDEIAVDFIVNDTDPGSDTVVQMMWSGGGQNPQDPSDMGRALVY